MQAISDYVRSRPALKEVARTVLRGLHAPSILRFDFVESALVWMLQKRIAWKVRHDWVYKKEPPHFSYNNYGCFLLAFKSPHIGAYPYYRGFLSAQLVRRGDKVLDIGCGDGFFSARFLASKAAHVDAIDIDADAIQWAKRYNRHSNVAYRLCDAVREPFPSTGYDLIAWDGAIGHFDAATTAEMIRKVRAALAKGGVFCGSEQLGRVDDKDHLQYWESLEEVRQLFTKHFQHVALHETEYTYNFAGRTRREYYWRCSEGPIQQHWA